jgi:hypothetical protein
MGSNYFVQDRQMNIPLPLWQYLEDPSPEMSDKFTVIHGVLVSVSFFFPSDAIDELWKHFYRVHYIFSFFKKKFP